MKKPGDDWKNYLVDATPEGILLTGFKSESTKPLTGKTLAEVASMRGKSPEETAMDLVIEDDSRVGTLYFLMPEESIAQKLRLPWVSLGSDEASLAPEGAFLKSNPHPRAYGTFARFLGKYVHEEKVVTLEEAIRRLTSLPAARLGLSDRGRVAEGFAADLVIFDPATVSDRATFAEPHQYAAGIDYVMVNGALAVDAGNFTGLRPGHVLRRGQAR